MADSQARIVLSAVDKTSGAFAAVQKNLSGIGAAAADVGGLISGIGSAAAVVALTGLVRRTADYADEMGKLAQKAGVTTEALSGLAYAASLSDVDNQALAKGLRVMANDAADGGEKLAALAISLQDAAGQAKTSDQLFLEVADRLSGIQDPARRAAAAAELFGDRVGPELLPLLLSGSQGIKDMTDEARRFGKIVTDEASASAQEFNDNLTRLQATASGFSMQLAGPIINGLNQVVAQFALARKYSDSFYESLFRTGTSNAPQRIEDLNKKVKDLNTSLKDPNLVGLPRARVEDAIKAAQKDLGLLSEFQRNQQLQDNKRLAAQYGKDNPKLASLNARVQPFVPTPVQTEPPKPPKPVRTPGGTKPAEFTGLSYDEQITQRVGKLFEDSDVTKAKEYADTLAKLDQLYMSGAIGGELYDSAVKKLSGSTSEAGKASTELADQQARLAQLLAGTASAALEEQRNDMLLLAAAFEKGTITARQFEEAASARLGLTGPDAQKASEGFSETLHGDVKDALSQAFRDSKNPVEAFGAALGNVVFTRLTNGIGNALADALFGSGGKGGGLFSGVSDFFGDLLSFDGGGHTGNMPRAGGMDGKGGFLAMLHPRETVVDHTKGQGAGGGAPVNITIHNQIGTVASQADVVAGMQTVRAQILGDLQRSARYGGALSA